MWFSQKNRGQQTKSLGLDFKEKSLKIDRKTVENSRKSNEKRPYLP